VLAEGNSMNLHDALRLLERMGYQASAAAEGLERPYDAMLLDVRRRPVASLPHHRRVTNGRARRHTGVRARHE
jgi:hypothetical protein